MSTRKLTDEEINSFTDDAYKAMSAPRSEQKIRITTMVDADILDELKAQAKKKNTKYQTLLNDTLRDVLFGERIDDMPISKLLEIAKDEANLKLMQFMIRKAVKEEVERKIKKELKLKNV